MGTVIHFREVMREFPLEGFYHHPLQEPSWNNLETDKPLFFGGKKLSF